jgi:hypothetical protein
VSRDILVVCFSEFVRWLKSLMISDIWVEPGRDGIRLFSRTARAVQPGRVDAYGLDGVVGLINIINYSFTGFFFVFFCFALDPDYPLIHGNRH